MTTERSRNRSSGFYSVDSVFVIFGVGIDFSTVRSGQNASPWPHKFFIFKCVPTSQADIHWTTGNTENKGQDRLRLWQHFDHADKTRPANKANRAIL